MAYPEQPQGRPTLKVEHIDLRKITRDADRFICEIRLDAGNFDLKHWITCGRIQIRFAERRGGRPAMLAARADYGITDQEHDSAYIFQIPIVGFEVSMVENGMTFAECSIGGEADDLRVPTKADYDPTKLDGASTCEDSSCKKSHAMVPEGYFAGPPVTDAVWRSLIGRRLEIVFGPARKDD